jgi:hypothetical protein
MQIAPFFLFGVNIKRDRTAKRSSFWRMEFNGPDFSAKDRPCYSMVCHPSTTTNLELVLVLEAVYKP